MKRPKRPKDTNQKAKLIVDMATSGEGDPEIKESVKATAGRKGGLKGGKARAKSLSAKRRKEIAKKAAKKRWG